MHELTCVLVASQRGIGECKDKDKRLVTKTSYFVFNFQFYGEPLQLLEKRFGVLCSTKFKNELV